MNGWQVDQGTYDTIRELVHRRSGISLGTSKQALVSARLRKRLRALNLPDYDTYIDYLSSCDDDVELESLVDVISTNVTSFFREPDHFKFITKQVQEWRNKGQTRFRFWSAACSTGEEPYSLAMSLLDLMNNQAGDTRILATDIATSALERSRKGVFSAHRVDRCPVSFKKRFFQPLSADGHYTITPAVRELVTVCRLNLNQVPYPMDGPFDIVLCRNVMIYFDNTTRRRVLEELYRLVRPGGFLLVGHAESLAGWISKFKPLKPSIFTK